MQDLQGKTTQEDLDRLQDRLLDLQIEETFEGADHKTEIAEIKRQLAELRGEE